MNGDQDKRPDRPDDPVPIATRAPAPRPRRLSRKILAIMAASGAFAVAGALAYSLSDGRRAPGEREAVSVDRRPTDVLEAAPRDYSDLAQQAAAGMGPPPANPADDASDAPAMDGSPAPTADTESPEEQRRHQQRESARGSALFAGNGGQRSGGRDAAPQAAAPQGEPAQPGAGGALAAARQREPTTNSGRLAPPAGHHVVTAGSTIAAALITGLSSDLPGQVVAQVTEDVFDSVTGQTRLIPQGTRLLGIYNSDIKTGQSRALVVWTRMILPDGSSIDLDRLVGTDAAGQSGFADRVNNHWGNILRAGLLSTLLGVGTQASGFGENGAIADAIRDSSGQTVGRAGDRIVERQLSVQPTITVRPGTRVRVLVSRDLLLAPWTGG